METEKKLVDYIVNASIQDMPQKAVILTKAIVLNALGAIIAGATVGLVGLSLIPLGDRPA